MVRLTDRPDMTLDVYRGRKTTIQQQQQYKESWLVGCFGFDGPLRQYFSLYRAVSQREGERGERIDESKNVQTTPTRTYCKRNRPLPYCNQNCRMPQHWKVTQHHRTTRPPPIRRVVVRHICDCVWSDQPVNMRSIGVERFLNIEGGGKMGRGGGQTFRRLLTDRSPCPQSVSVPNNYISQIEN